MNAPEILLIDDEVHGSVLRKKVLESKGYRVQIALDAQSGLALALALKPALILLDHAIPPISGPDVFKALRKVLPSTPVISHSGYEALSTEYDPPPDAFLTKGDSVQLMLRTIASLIAEP